MGCNVSALVPLSTAFIYFICLLKIEAHTSRKGTATVDTAVRLCLFASSFGRPLS